MDDEGRGPGWHDRLLFIVPNSHTCESVASLSTLRYVVSVKNSSCLDALFFCCVVVHRQNDGTRTAADKRNHNLRQVSIIRCRIPWYHHFKYASRAAALKNLN